MNGKIMKRSTKRRRVRAVPASSSMLPADLTDDALLSRPEAAFWLTRAGARITAHRLAVLATLGSGPAYTVVFNRAKYRIPHLKAWFGELTAVTFTSAAARFEHQRRARQERPQVQRQTSPPPREDDYPDMGPKEQGVT
jgi:hypothetical protein